MNERKDEIKIKNGAPFVVSNKSDLLHSILTHILLYISVYTQTNSMFGKLQWLLLNHGFCLWKSFWLNYTSCHQSTELFDEVWKWIERKDNHKQQLVYAEVSPPRLLMRVFWTLMLFLLKWMSFLYQQWVAKYYCIDGALLNSTLFNCMLSQFPEFQLSNRI
jgi:hypothetical protein